VDVARALGVSHGAVYRHFPSKQALREAVTRHWLHQFHTILEPIDDPREWIRALSAAKRDTARADPELFATYQALCDEQSGVVDEHVAWMVDQLEQLVGDEGKPLLQATTRFHHPAHVHEWSDPEIERDLERVLDLVLRDRDQVEPRDRPARGA
jgi:AcrR family transcriptional regulator